MTQYYERGMRGGGHASPMSSTGAVLRRPYTASAERSPDISVVLGKRTLDASWKRALDVTLSLVALLCLWPVMLVAALAVKVTSPGPVVFKQERVGLNRRFGERRHDRAAGGRSAVRRGKDRRVVVSYGKPFTMYKFRTMVVDAEGDRPVWTAKGDSRITPVGTFLRRTRIDELPQFLNVLRGDMSIVGPRPERAYFIAEIEKELPQFQQRLRTKPGITGLAQVELGYTNTKEGMYQKLRFDLDYIRNLTPVSDLKILFKTVSVVISGRGAY